MDFIPHFSTSEASGRAQKIRVGLATALRIGLKLLLGEDFVACAEPTVKAIIFQATNRTRRVILSSPHGHTSSLSLH
jgi:hypothetical protein